MGRAWFCLILCPVLLSAPIAWTEIYRDDFDDGVVASNLSSIGGASLTEGGGLMTVGIANPGQGLALDVPTDAINCMLFDYAGLTPAGALGPGDQIRWQWRVTDPMTSTSYVVLESVWEQVGTFTTAPTIRFTATKKNASGAVVMVHQEVAPGDLTAVNPGAGEAIKIKWDRREVSGETQVQCEIVRCNRATGQVLQVLKLFPWQDPPSFVSDRIEVTANFAGSIAFEAVAGDDLHEPTSVPALGLPWIAALGVLLAAAFVLFNRRSRPVPFPTRGVRS